jgi:hypothetical protein
MVKGKSFSFIACLYFVFFICIVFFERVIFNNPSIDEGTLDGRYNVNSNNLRAKSSRLNPDEKKLFEQLTDCHRPQYATYFDCQTGNVPQGFGSCFHVLSQRAADSIDKGATLHYSGHTIWSHSPLFSDYFDFPWCVSEDPPAKILDYAGQSTYWHYDSPSIFHDFNSKQKFRRTFTGLMFKHIKPAILKEVDKWGTKPDVVVHIRWGDKLSSGESTKKNAISEYIDAIIRQNTGSHANVFVMSVSEQAVKLFKQHAPNSWNIITEPSLEYYKTLPPNGDSTFGIANTLQKQHGSIGMDLIKSLIYASKAEIFVINTESNLSRLLNEMRLQTSVVVDLAATDIPKERYEHIHWRRLISTPFSHCLPTTPGKISLVTAFTLQPNNIHSTILFNETIESWLSQDYIDEFIFIDWSSTPEFILFDQFQKYRNHAKIKIIRVNHKEHFILSMAYNMGVCAASGEIIIKVDTDFKLSPDFVLLNNIKELTPKTYLSGKWWVETSENEKHINGMLVVYREDFKAIWGYDERITEYGFDDSDLYIRLNIYGNRTCCLNSLCARFYLNEHFSDTVYDKSIQKNVAKRVGFVCDSTRKTVHGVAHINHKHNKNENFVTKQLMHIKKNGPWGSNSFNR